MLVLTGRVGTMLSHLSPSRGRVALQSAFLPLQLEEASGDRGRLPPG